MKMLKIYSILLIIISIAVSSCNDFLEEDPQNQVATSNYYTTEQDAIAAVNAVYAYLGSYDLSRGNTAGIYHSTFWVAQGLASDEMSNNQLGTPQFDQLATFSYNADNVAVEEIWKMHYKTIYLANIAIERIPGISMEGSLKNRLVNEAKFLRGLLYFNLVRMFGDVPLLLNESTPLNPEASKVEAIYTQIINDLTAAEALPPEGSIQDGRATRGAAKALLAKVYLTRAAGKNDYEKASEKAWEVIQSGKYELWENFSDAFKVANRGGKEAIFSVGFGDGGGAISFWEVGQFNVRLLPAELSAENDSISNTQGWQVATSDLYNAFEAGDARRDATFMTAFVDQDGENIALDKIYIEKYWDRVANPKAADSYNDFPVMRYAEVLLIYAEAQAELDNFDVANEYLNKVRNRANLVDVDINDLEQFRAAILQERRKEFVAEGMRWFDLVRTGKLEERVEAAKEITALSTDYYRFPIPQRERLINPNLPQNSGY